MRVDLSQILLRLTTGAATGPTELAGRSVRPAGSEPLLLRIGDLVNVRILANAVTSPQPAPGGKATSPSVPVSGRSDGNFITVEINGKRALARALPGTAAGETFTARVVAAGPPPVLKRMTPGAAAETALARAKFLAAEKAAHPHRESVRSLESIAGRLPRAEPRQASAAASGERSMSARQIVERLVADLTPARQLTDPSRLREAVRLSGVAYEHRIVRALTQAAGNTPAPLPAGHAAPHKTPDTASTAAARDVKAALLRLAALLDMAPAVRTPAMGFATPVPDRPPLNAAAPPETGQYTPADSTEQSPLREAAVRELSRSVSSMLARIELSQLGSAVQEAHTGFRVIDVPLRADEHLEGFELAVGDDGEREPEPGAVRRSVRLRLDLGRLGPLLVTMQLALRGDAGGSAPLEHLSLHFVAQKGELAHRVADALAGFRAHLAANGYQVERMSSEHGRVPATLQASVVQTPLVDVAT